MAMVFAVDFVDVVAVVGAVLVVGVAAVVVVATVVVVAANALLAPQHQETEVNYCSTDDDCWHLLDWALYEPPTVIPPWLL
jgi:hypothetical protein